MHETYIAIFEGELSHVFYFYYYIEKKKHDFGHMMMNETVKNKVNVLSCTRA